MAIEIDGAAVLLTLAQRSELFPDAAHDYARAARTLVVKQLKARATGLPEVRAIAQAIGAQALGLILDGLNDAETKALVARIDKGGLDTRSAPPDAVRRHLIELSNGRVDMEAAQSPPASAEPTLPPLRHESVQAKRKKVKKK